ncbi:MAG: DoxX family protein, partial [Pyrinomonadaceae bacterium]
GNFSAAQTVCMFESRQKQNTQNSAADKKSKGENKIMEISKIWQWFANPPTSAPTAAILLRLMAGGVFFWEGILKFVYANQGVGRFTKLGFPFPEFTANFIGVLEIVGGLLLIFGLFTRFISFVFIGEMIVAILSTKISLYLGTSPLPLPPAPPQIGFWGVLHDIRSDYAQIMTCAFLLIAGSGKLSLDSFLAKRREQSRQSIAEAVAI